jgi:hypothetical protein
VLRPGFCLAPVLWRLNFGQQFKQTHDGAQSSESDALFATWATVIARFPVLGFNAFAIGAIVVIVVHVSMLRTIFLGFGVIGIHLSHLISPVRGFDAKQNTPEREPEAAQPRVLHQLAD